MIGGLKPYPAMKDSGVAWLGEVPEHWEVRKLRHVLRRRAERNRHDLPLLSVVREKGVILRNTTSADENHNYIPDDLSNYKLVRAGQFAMNKMKAWQGSYGVSPYDGIVSPAYFVFDLADIAGPFFNTAIRSRAYVPSFTQASDGVRIGQWDLSETRMREIPVLVPPLPEQTAIVRFLDHADRRIRRYIRAKQKLIKLLEEQKQAIIHRAVTRGLDPDVRLKPSGVEWLGEVPEHWEVRKLRQCVSIFGGSTPSMADRSLWGGDVPWVTPKDMKRFTIESASMNVSAKALEVTSLRLIPAGAVLLVVRGMILARRVPIARTTQSVTINQDMKALVPDSGIDAGYLAYRMDAAQAAFVPMIDEAGHGTKRFPTERWRDSVFAFPPADEQREIVRWTQDATAEVGAALRLAESEISLLREFRTRLIADVVTGKLDVREAAARLPEEAEDLELLDEAEVQGDAEETDAGDGAGVPEEVEA